MRWSMPALMVLLAACSGGDKNDMETPDTDDTEDTDIVDTVDTAEDAVFSPVYYTVTGSFAVDPASDYDARAHTGYDQLGATVETPVYIVVTLADATVAQTGSFSSSNSCSVQFVATANVPQNKTWGPDSDLWYSIEAPAGAQVASDCTSKTFDSAWGSDPVSHVTKWSWGIGLGPLDADTRTQLSQQLSAADWAELEPKIAGGGFYHNALAGSNLTETGFVGGGYTVGTELDGSWTWVVDGGQPVLIDAALMQESTAVMKGAYVTNGILISPAADVLLSTPL